jgi:tetratricopeptide (TPR) repeat protein
MYLIRWMFILFLGVACAAAAQEKDGMRGTDSGEAAQMERLTKAQQLIGTGQHQAAITLIDETLSYYAQRYPEGATRWYVVRTPQETLMYMASAAASEQPNGKASAMALDVLWADAFYMRAYALVEIDQPDAAKSALESALQLTPQNSRYLSELGQIHQTRHAWDEALRQYEAAESAAEFSPPEEKLRDLTRAKRGIGFVLIEQGKLDAAEAKFRQCLALDPDDRGARNELEYIEEMRAKAGRSGQR